MRSTETLKQALTWDAYCELFTDYGLTADDASVEAYAAVENEYLRDVLKHVIKYYSDAHIQRDMDAIPSHPAFEAYASARKRARGFIGKSYQRNNHKNIPRVDRILAM